MAYSELIKNFSRIRNYMNEFYVYGFKTREEYEIKSARSYDNERRRIESFLGDYMGFRQTSTGKNVFLSIDSRKNLNNPLYKALKAKSFTNGDITLHFILFDILYSNDVEMTLKDISKEIDEKYLSVFSDPMIFDESGIRKKLKEYVELGIINVKKQGKTVIYSRAETIDLEVWKDPLMFFSEAGFCGVIGSFLMDKAEISNNMFQFKHHYITHAIESEILCELFEAITDKRTVTIVNLPRRSGTAKTWEIIPLKIYISVQNGRRYIFGYNISLNRIISYRIDYITSVKQGKVAENFEEHRKNLQNIQKNMWGVLMDSRHVLEHVEFTLKIADDEEYIFFRLEREKRCGIVERIDRNTCRFSADIYDTGEMIPWIRTFICRIVSFRFSNRTVENQFRKDLEEMYLLYDLGGSK